jgi:peptidoglycan/xylan/chitin deacetylase (PgdA/CDA1 family)
MMATERLSALRIGLKRAIKTVLGLISWPVALLRRPQGPRVLFYHRVNPYAFADLGPVSRELRVQPEDFAWQLRHLARRGFRPVSAEAFQAMIAGSAPPDPRAVLITFDDGYEDNLIFAAPALQAARAPALLFVATGFIDRQSRDLWPHGDAAGAGRFLTAAQVAEIGGAGVTIGSHTVTHPRMTTLSDDATLRDELAASRATLERLAGRPVTTFAYPEGDLDDRVADLVRAAGYTMAFTTETGAIAAGADPLRLRRTEVSASDSRLIFALKLSGALDWTRVKDSAPVRRFIRRVNDALLARQGKTG